jgi:glycosyltransferase involved in cell wall biosynthesis
VQEQANMLRDFGHQVTVIHPFMLGTFAQNLGKRSYHEFTVEEEIPVLRVGVVPPIPFFRSVSYRTCYHRILESLKKNNLDISSFQLIHSHAAFMGGIIAFKLHQDFAIPYVHTEHTSGLIFNPAQYSSYDLEILRKVYLHAAKVLFVSQFAQRKIQEDLLKLSSKNNFVMPNLVHRSFFEISGSKRAKAMNFLLIGNFIRVKNHELLFDAWKLVLNTMPSLQLTLVGEGETMRKYQERALELNPTGIHFRTRQMRSDLLRLMQEHDVVLSTSSVETFGLTIAEAQAMGKPVVVTDSGGVRDIVLPETGIMTELSPEAFANGLIKLIESFDSYDAEAIRQTAQRRFSSKVIIQQLNGIYDHALDSFDYL